MVDRQPAVVQRAYHARWLDSAESTASVVCQVAEGCCLQMSPSAYWLYSELQQQRSPDEIARMIRITFGQDIAAAEVAKVCDELTNRVEAETTKAQRARKRRYWFRIRLLPESVVAVIARRLEFMFSGPAAVIYLVLASVGSYLIFFTNASRMVGPHLSSGSGFLAAYLIYLVALAAHELGHATACSRYRMRPGDIGLAVYMFMPVLYCDVTRAWMLPRRQRVVVDVSGLLFEFGVGSLFAVTGVVLHMWVFVMADLFVLGNLVMALNPVGRFDLYWTISDSLGLISLSQDRWRVFRELRQGRNRARRSSSVSLGRASRLVLASYGVVCVLLLGMFGYGFVGIASVVITHVPANMSGLGHAVLRGDAAAVLARGFSLIFPVLLAGMMGWRLAAMVVRPVVKGMRSRLARR